MIQSVSRRSVILLTGRGVVPRLVGPVVPLFRSDMFRVVRSPRRKLRGMLISQWSIRRRVISQMGRFLSLIVERLMRILFSLACRRLRRQLLFLGRSRFLMVIAPMVWRFPRVTSGRRTGLTGRLRCFIVVLVVPRTLLFTFGISWTKLVRTHGVPLVWIVIILLTGWRTIVHAVFTMIPRLLVTRLARFQFLAQRSSKSKKVVARALHMVVPSHEHTIPIVVWCRKYGHNLSSDACVIFYNVMVVKLAVAKTHCLANLVVRRREVVRRKL